MVTIDVNRLMDMLDELENKHVKAKDNKSAVAVEKVHDLV